MKKVRRKNNTVIYLSVIGVILIAYVWFLDDIYSLFNGKMPDYEKPEQTEEFVCSWSGVYKKGDNVANLYKIDDNTLAVVINDENKEYKINKNSASSSSFKIECTNNKVKIDNTEYSKTGNYTMTDYFDDVYGESSFALANNGVYTVNNETIKMYQIDETTILVKENGKSTKYTKADDMYINNESNIAFSFAGEDLEKLEKDANLNYNLINTYKKTKAYTIEEIIKEK